MEPFLNEIDNRFVLFPIRYNAIWKMYKKALSAFWTAEEIDLSKDYDDWKNLNSDEQHFVKHILAFFAGSDGIVNENLSVRFMNEVKCQEAKCFYGFQIAMENVHCVTGDTKILTSEGYINIQNAEKKVVQVWNGEEWTQTMVFKTSNGATAWAVILDNGMNLMCTSNHKWLISGKEDRVFTKDLQEGQVIEDFEYPVVELEDSFIFSNAYEHGKISCDGTDLSEYSPIKFNCRYREYVPINYSLTTRLLWLSGVIENLQVEENGMASIPVPDVEFGINLQLLFSTIGIKVVFSRIDGLYIIIDKEGADKIEGMHILIPNKHLITQSHGPIKIQTVHCAFMKLPMYCFEECNRNTGVFNGILTGQSETYSLLLDTYIKDKTEKTRLLNAINTIPCIAKKAEWAMKWISDEQSSFATRLVAFACVEGIFFSGAFCAIFWLKERGILPGLTLSNEFISRDESLHTEFAILMYQHLENKLSDDEIKEIVTSAVVIEDEFINDSISCNMLGMNRDLMSQYIKYVADRLVIQLGYTPIYNVQNPFDFMERISLSNKSNFFEHTRQSEYAMARVGNTQEANSFALDADF